MNTPLITLSDRTRLRTTYFVESLLSFSGNLLFVGIFFYTTKLFGWGIIQNFLLAAGQGVAYVLAALLTQKISHVFGKRTLLLASNIASAALLMTATLLSPGPGAGVVPPARAALLTGMLLCYVPLLGVNWPMLESLVSAGAAPHEMSRRIGVYNLVWSGTGALSMIVQGSILKTDPRGVFLIPTLIHTTVAITILLVGRYGGRGVPAGHAHLEPEPRLVRQRTIALWLSRITLPSTYVIIYSLSALMPLLPTIHHLPTQWQTPIASVWMVSRWLIFLLLGATVFWHTRPRLLLGAAAIMLVSFLGVTLAPSALGAPAGLDLPLMIGAQILLGSALGLIYFASLYFGMVLSQASTEHAGYHEALIGLGQVLGPASGALTQWIWPGSLVAGVGAVGSIISVSIVLACFASLRARWKREASPD